MKVYRIRKLTPKEVGRFMGVKDKDIDTMIKSGLSDDSLCRMFGNSIVVNCMSHMFRNLFIKKTKRRDKNLW